MTEVVINGVAYVPKDAKMPAADVEGMPYVILRTYSAGVHAGYLESRDGKEAVLQQARRIWRWKGAATLSELSQSGTSSPGECKFPETVFRAELTEVIEVLHCTEKAKASIESVPVWSSHD